MTSSERGSHRRLQVGAADPELDARLSDELSNHNFAASGVSNLREFTVKAEDDEGQLVAGLSGWTWGNCAGIGMVWVRQDSRQDGWGGLLLEAAERVARERGCQQVLVSSFTFQAPGFYERHGYVEFGRTEGLPVDGAADVHFSKRLGGHAP
jgi:GNAT superfamily N-acetyltransferase